MADILIIANPASGKFKIMKPLLHKIMVILQEKADKVELILTEYRGHGTYLAQNSSSHVIIAAGGDGLVNEVAKGVVNTDKLFYVLPFGTKNVFCKEYGISVNPLIAAKHLDLSNIKKIPVGYIDNKIFLLMAGVGFDAHVVRNVEKKGVRLCRVFLHLLLMNTAECIYIYMVKDMVFIMVFLLLLHLMQGHISLAQYRKAKLTVF